MGDGKGDVDLAAGVVRRDRGIWRADRLCRAAAQGTAAAPTDRARHRRASCPRRAGRAGHDLFVRTRPRDRGRRHRARSREWRVRSGAGMSFLSGGIERQHPVLVDAADGRERCRPPENPAGRGGERRNTCWRHGPASRQRSPARCRRSASQTGTSRRVGRVEIITQSDRSVVPSTSAARVIAGPFPRAASGPIGRCTSVFPRWPRSGPRASRRRRCRPCRFHPAPPAHGRWRRASALRSSGVAWVAGMSGLVHQRTSGLNRSVRWS